MRKGIFYLFAVCAAMLVTSCDKFDSGDWDLPAGYAYATVKDAAVGVGLSQETVYFELDNGNTFYIGENKSSVDYSDFSANSRVLVGITLYDSDYTEYDYMAKLYGLASVLVGENETVNTDEESDAIADDKLLYMSTSVSLTRGYLNLYAYYETSDNENVKFYLVENTMEELDDEYDDYLYLELRFDDAVTSSSDETYDRYVSFNMESFQTQLEGKNGVILRVKTAASGTSKLIVDSYKLFDDE